MIRHLVLKHNNVWHILLAILCLDQEDSESDPEPTPATHLGYLLNSLDMPPWKASLYLAKSSPTQKSGAWTNSRVSLMDEGVNERYAV